MVYELYLSEAIIERKVGRKERRKVGRKSGSNLNSDERVSLRA